MNIPQPHVESLMEFSYTEPEARFLYIVATHSGYFILRQYLAFTGARRGKRSSVFARKLLNNGHALVRDYMGYGSIYHLFSRTLYGQIDKENLRNRRAHSFEFIRTRLVLLDFVLSNLNLQYLETEPEKVDFFTRKMRIPMEFLPCKVYEGGPGSRPTIRYFVDKFPLSIAAPLPDLPPVVTFSYVDSGIGTISGFLTHLSGYKALFRQLGSFRFLYISPRQSELPKASECFRSSVKTPLESDGADDLLRYFEVRKRFEERRYVVPVTEDFEFLSGAKQRFCGERFEALYESWDKGRVTEREIRQEFGENKRTCSVSFDTYLVTNHRSHLDRLQRESVNVA